MANRPVANIKSKKKTPKSQAEINRIKPDGVMTLEGLQQQAKTVNSVNVKLGDQVLRFFHLPMTVADAKEFSTTKEVHVTALQRLLSELLVNEDGSQFAAEEDLDSISTEALNKIFHAILESAKEEPGED